MVTISSLFLAVILSAAAVWIVSAVIWMVLPWHKTDFRALPNEEAARSALQGAEAGQYNLPHVTSPADIKNPEMQQKFEEGPLGFITIVPNGVPSMGRGMILSFVFYVIVGVMVAYVGSRALPAGAEYLKVFQITGTVAFLAHSFAVIPDAIWFGRPTSSIWKALLDGFIYANITGGVFGWLWPDVMI